MGLAKIIMVKYKLSILSHINAFEVNNKLVRGLKHWLTYHVAYSTEEAFL